MLNEDPKVSPAAPSRQRYILCCGHGGLRRELIKRIAGLSHDEVRLNLPEGSLFGEKSRNDVKRELQEMGFKVKTMFP